MWREARNSAFRSYTPVRFGFRWVYQACELLQPLRHNFNEQIHPDSYPVNIPNLYPLVGASRKSQHSWLLSVRGSAVFCSQIKLGRSASSTTKTFLVYLSWRMSKKTLNTKTKNTTKLYMATKRQFWVCASIKAGILLPVGTHLRKLSWSGGQMCLIKKASF